jgi:hypothetical protein
VVGIRVRSGRDDKFVAGKWLSAHSEKTAVNGSTNLSLRPEFFMGLWPIQGDEKRLGPETTLYGTTALSFVIPRGCDFF